MERLRSGDSRRSKEYITGARASGYRAGLPEKSVPAVYAEKKNSARIVAGFCWPWSDPNPDGNLEKDVPIGDFAMPWQKKDTFWKWATDDTGMEQVGTVYTAQGFEFDYIGVIFGNDLGYDADKNQWQSVPQNSHDTQVKRKNPDLTRHLQNVYRVLMSRAHRGVYVYFMNKQTEQHFRNGLPELNDN